MDVKRRKKRPGRGIKRGGIILGAFVAILAVLTLCGYLLPSQVQLANTSVVLNASSAALFPYFNSRAGQQRLWTEAWRRSGGKKLPPMEIANLGGPDAGVGARLGFFPDGRRLGSIAGALSSVSRGEGVIVESDPDVKVVIDIDFGIAVSRRTIGLEAIGEETTNVNWSETVEISNPLLRYLPLLVDSTMNESFKEVLAAAEDVANVDGGVAR